VWGGGGGGGGRGGGGGGGGGRSWGRLGGVAGRVPASKRRDAARREPVCDPRNEIGRTLEQVHHVDLLARGGAAAQQVAGRAEDEEEDPHLPEDPLRDAAAGLHMEPLVCRSR